jgi:aryl carrier-like protein
VDRQALPALTVAAAASYREPATPAETSLAAAFRKVLGVERVGVDDNYFALGGDSLRVIQVVHEARRYGLTLGATDVLRHQTVGKLCRALQEKALSSLFPDGFPALPAPSPETMQDLPDGVVDAYPLSGIQSFVIEKYAQDHKRKGVYHIQESIHIRDAGFSLPALEAAFRTVVDRHPALRTVIVRDSFPPMQWVRSDLTWKLQVEDISHLNSAGQQEYIDAAMRSDRSRPFDLSDRQSPLFRVAVFVRSAGDLDWFFSCHHAIMDGWGHRAFMNELVRSYLTIKAGKKPDPIAPDRIYHEFVLYQEAVRNSEKAREFWRGYLQGAGPASLSCATPPVPVEGEPGTAVHVLEPAAVEALSQVSRSSAVSMQALVLGAWCESLRILTGCELVIVGVLMNGRSEFLSDPLSAVGLFWNIAPVVSRVSQPPLQQAAAVHKDLIEIQPYSAYPLPQLLEDHGGNDLFFCSFRYLNFWNLQQLPAESGLQLLGLRAFDRFSFPLACTASFNPVGGDAVLRLEYDTEVFAAGAVRSALDRFVSLLRDLAAAS